jgi:hypothetical protein
MGNPNFVPIQACFLKSSYRCSARGRRRSRKKKGNSGSVIVRGEEMNKEFIDNKNLQYGKLPRRPKMETAVDKKTR